MPTDPKHIRDLFLAAADLTAAERTSFLDANCSGDAEVRAAVERLLAAHDEPAPILARSAPGMPTADYAPITERPGTKIGPYILREQIGEGGFGLVFVAEQQEPVKRKVALKIIKPGMDTAQVIARFEAERQALAMMDHPNIARVFDAGTTGLASVEPSGRREPGETRRADASTLAMGRPYFVMELVRGIPITEYCDKNQLAPKERLELFITVCQAIQHAHQKGIIHRDVKPSNVLVTSHDGKPVAKVIDFGVAKAIHQHLTERTIYTNFAQMIGTPLYMSPEQAEMSGLDIDTRSDIYSLGVLLYELLTGSTPLEKKRFAKAAYDEIRRLIREEEPPKPSTRLSTSESIASIAAQRHTEPAKLSKLVRGDLDWITMKCLEKDRTRRYETANGLARDIQRYLSDEPVEACPPSTTYRLRKFARKNRAALTTAAAIAFLLVAGIGVSVWQAVRANRAADAERIARTDAEDQKANALQATQRETAERVKAQKARADETKQKKLAQEKVIEANAVIYFFEYHVFAVAGPKGVNGGLGHDVTLRDAIVASLPALAKGFKNHPRVEARLRDTLGRTFLNLEDPKAASEQLELALAILTERINPPDLTFTWVNKEALATSYHALGRYPEALKLREELLASYKRTYGLDNLDTLDSMWRVAESLVALNRGAEAVPLIDECIARSAGKSSVRNSRMIPSVMRLRLQHFRKAGDPAGCRATAVMWENLNRTDVASLYDAACWRAVAAAVQAKDPAGMNPAARQLAKDDADRAMAWLTKAVVAGYKDKTHMAKDTDLDALREREDFKKLLVELGKK